MLQLAGFHATFWAARRLLGDVSAKIGDVGKMEIRSAKITVIVVIEQVLGSSVKLRKGCFFDVLRGVVRLVVHNMLHLNFFRATANGRASPGFSLLSLEGRVWLRVPQVPSVPADKTLLGDGPDSLNGKDLPPVLPLFLWPIQGLFSAKTMCLFRRVQALFNPHPLVMCRPAQSV
jgi:hypothetical protein